MNVEKEIFNCLERSNEESIKVIDNKDLTEVWEKENSENGNRDGFLSGNSFEISSYQGKVYIFIDDTLEISLTDLPDAIQNSILKTINDR